MHISNPARRTAIALACLAALSAAPAFADDGVVTVYGVLDAMVDQMHANGKSIVSVDDNGLMVSRFGIRGFEPFDGGARLKFALEGGINPVTGAQKDSNRLFDRQAWIGYAASFGELRVGRQNTKLFYMGDDTDATQRATFASFINNTGIVSRYDNDLSYISPKLSGLGAELHHSFGGQPGSASGGAINQLGLDWRGTDVPVYVGLFDLQAKPFSGLAYNSTVKVESLITNVDYGRGKVYYVWERSNNITGFGTGQALSNVGGNAPGTTPVASAAAPYYNFNQVSADFRPTQTSSIGFVYGTGKDKSGGGNNVKGGGLIGEYDLSKRTRFYGAYGYMSNSKLATFKLSGGGAPTKNFANADVTGQSVRGIQAGVRHFF